MDRDKGRIKPGARVEARDGPLGTVIETVMQAETGEPAHLLVRGERDGQVLRIPMDLIASAPNQRTVRLSVTRHEAMAQSQAQAGVPSAKAASAADELRIPIAEERLHIHKVPTEQGELRIHTSVEQTEQVIREALTRDDLVIERVPVDQPIDQPLQPRREGDWLIVPVMEEVLVVRKQLMLKEEVRIQKRQVTEEREFHEPVRRTRIDLEDATQHRVSGDVPPSHPQPGEEPAARPPTASSS